VRLVLERRAEHSQAMAILSPLVAIGLTLIAGAIIFALLGLDPLYALYIYFVDPLTSLWSLEQLVVKATPLILIGVGLAVCFTANVWNIGAEGQFTMGAIFASMVPILMTDWQSPLALGAMMALGCIGGMLWAFIPAILKTRFGASEILTSLMLVYVAQLLLDWLVRGPWRDPMGFNFPQSATFQGWHLMPTFGGTVHLGSILAVVIVLVLAVMMGRTLTGFEVKVLGNAPRAGRFAGFSRNRMVIFCFLLAGALAGLAGMGEIASTVGQLQPSISPGYGFTAIIVAFLGRLNPIGVLLAGLLLAISYLGGEGAQITLGISDKIARVFQGILLFFVLACDTLILYRVRFETGRAPRLAPGE
jgi:general nucleoside transport system permease protein